jgi:hypothetical protein
MRGLGLVLRSLQTPCIMGCDKFWSRKIVSRFRHILLSRVINHDDGDGTIQRSIKLHIGIFQKRKVLWAVLQGP